MLRVDETTGHVRTIPTGRLTLGGFQHDLAAGDGALWMLQHRYTGRRSSTLVRFDVRTGEITGTVSVPGIADAVVVKPNAVWVATVIAPANKPASGYEILRFDPRTLRRTLLVHIV